MSGTVTIGGSPLPGVALTTTNGGSCGQTNASGQNDCVVPYGWSGDVTPAKAG